MSKVEFEFVVPGPPLSVNTAKSQSGKHRKWREKVRQAAKAQWDREERTSETIPTDRPVEIRIATYFTLLALDVDNVIKPIMDSLKGTIYKDDKQIYHLTSLRVDLKSPPTIESPSLLLADALETYPELVHVELSWKESEDE